MSSTIAVEDLRVGMFIQLDGGWLSHPFPLSSFRVASAEQIATLRGLGLARLRWVPEKSELEPVDKPETAAGVQPGPSADQLTAQERHSRLDAQREAAQRC
jgi:hypothetical protein